MKQKTIVITKMPEESKRQYAAWLFYCEMESINKLLKKWKDIQIDRSKVPRPLKEVEESFGEIISRGTAINWSKKFHWVERKGKKLTEDSKIILEKMRKIKMKEWDKILEILPKFYSVRNEPMEEFMARTNKIISDLNQNIGKSSANMWRNFRKSTQRAFKKGINKGMIKIWH